jgi:hypothetical protein
MWSALCDVLPCGDDATDAGEEFVDGNAVDRAGVADGLEGRAVCALAKTGSAGRPTMALQGGVMGTPTAATNTGGWCAQADSI